MDPRVDRAYAKEFREAVAVLPASAKASATLSRRLLQRLIHEKIGIKGRSLDEEIQAVIKEKHLPAETLEDLDAVRTVGNFAAHPIKSANTGEIVDVEPGEAQWQIDTIRSLFDQLLVKPALHAKRKAELNKKLTVAGKGPLKK